MEACFQELFLRESANARIAALEPEQLDVLFNLLPGPTRTQV